MHEDPLYYHPIHYGYYEGLDGPRPHQQDEEPRTAATTTPTHPALSARGPDPSTDCNTRLEVSPPESKSGRAFGRKRAPGKLRLTQPAAVRQPPPDDPHGPPFDDDEAEEVQAVSSPRNPIARASLAALKSAFQCPICHELMKDPVIDCEGNSYEHTAIMRWLERNPVSPLTRSPLQPQDLRPNRSLKAAITHFEQLEGDARQSPPSKRGTAHLWSFSLGNRHERLVRVTDMSAPSARFDLLGGTKARTRPGTTQRRSAHHNEWGYRPVHMLPSSSTLIATPE